MPEKLVEGECKCLPDAQDEREELKKKYQTTKAGPGEAGTPLETMKNHGKLHAYTKILKLDPDVHTPWLLQRFWPSGGNASATLTSAEIKTKLTVQIYLSTLDQEKLGLHPKRRRASNKDQKRLAKLFQDCPSNKQTKPYKPHDDKQLGKEGPLRMGHTTGGAGGKGGCGSGSG